MLVSYNWLNKYFDNQLPPADVLAEKLTFHAWEIESVEDINDDTVLDIKVLPDKSMWALSHRGIAKDLSVILNLPLAKDPLKSPAPSLTSSRKLSIAIDTETCRRFAAVQIDGVKVGPSPEWLKLALAAIGQRSINNIVDASNYVMFDLGQPSHAFDASQVGDKGFWVRQSKAGEKLTGLDEVEYVFNASDTLIARGDNGEALSIAGLKGGQHSGISATTTSVIVEVANWDPVAIRKTGQRLKLRTDASARYENGVVPEMVPYGLKTVVDLIIEVAGGEVVAVGENIITPVREPKTVTISLQHLNSVLGLSLEIAEVESVIQKFGWEYKVTEGNVEIISPFERTDLNISEDIIEEIGRIYGYQHVTAITPAPVPLTEVNQRHYYSEKIRETLTNIGFSEIFTSSFRSSDLVKLANAFAADKGYLRSSLIPNMGEALGKNAPNADLLGLRQIKLFEIGTVFFPDSEKFMLALGVQSPGGYKTKTDDPILEAAAVALSDALGVEIKLTSQNGVAEIDFGALLQTLPVVTKYETVQNIAETFYQPFSIYPSMSRDVAMWVNAETSAEEVQQLLHDRAGDLCVRITLFDQFEKDNRVSYAFRLVFQSKEKTLEGSEVDAVMNNIYQVLNERGFETR